MRSVQMKRTVDRRRFVGLLGATGIVGTAGCIGGAELLDDDPGEPAATTDDGNGDEQDESNAEETETFDFPQGADENGLVVETIVSRARKHVTETDRYRVTQDHEIDYRNGNVDTTTITYDAGDGAVHERELQNDLEIDRWVTRDHTVSRFTTGNDDLDARGRSEPADPLIDSDRRFHHYPFERTTVPMLLESTSFDFDGIVTDDERSYARYTGDVVWTDELKLRRWNSARIAHQLESVSDGNVSVLLAENGRIRTVEYELVGEVARLTHNGREVLDTVTSGTVQFEYDDLGSLAAPEWSETDDSTDVREFSVEDRSLGRVYELFRGPSLPGSINLRYAEFYVTAQFGEERYVVQYHQPRDFDVGDRLFVGFDGELSVDRTSNSGGSALVEADRVEVSVYLYAPREERVPVFHETVYPS